jgi:hypothetical protein
MGDLCVSGSRVSSTGPVLSLGLHRPLQRFNPDGCGARAFSPVCTRESNLKSSGPLNNARELIVHFVGGAAIVTRTSVDVCRRARRWRRAESCSRHCECTAAADGCQ